MTRAVTEAEVRAALDEVNDPHVPVSLRNMGMLAGLKIEDGWVTVRVRIPCMACPGMGLLREHINDAISSLPGVAGVEMLEDWADPWDRELVSVETKNLMRERGIQL